jgi:benzodiazapine receptor
MKPPRVTTPFLFIFGCEFVGILGSYFTVSAIPNWYVGLVKPVFNPPNWLFGPVWSFLYALMGISAYLVWEKRKDNKNFRKATQLFLAQLFLNGIWSPVFFGLRNLLLALFVIIALLILIILTILQFYRIEEKAAYLLTPYLLWVSFASVLNFSVWILNK